MKGFCAATSDPPRRDSPLRGIAAEARHYLPLLWAAAEDRRAINGGKWGGDEKKPARFPTLFFFFAEQNKKSCMVWLFKAMRCRLLPWSNSFRIVFSIHWLVTGKIEAPRRWHGAPGCPAVGLYSSGCKSSEHTLVWSLPPALSSSFSKVRCVLVRGCQSHFLVIVNHNKV